MSGAGVGRRPRKRDGRAAAAFVRGANSPGILTIVFLALITVAALVYSLLEDAGVLNSLYWAVVTATTLGYGDFAPHSEGGKLLTGILITATVFVLIPTITANLASKLIVNRDVFTHEEQEEIKATLRAVLARLDHDRPGTPPNLEETS